MPQWYSIGVWSLKYSCVLVIYSSPFWSFQVLTRSILSCIYCTFLHLYLGAFLNKKKRKTVKGADNFVSQHPHQSLLSPEALLQQYFSRQISYRCYLCSQVCIQVWVYPHARACVGSFEALAQVYDIKRVAWRSPCLLVSRSGRAGVELWRLLCFTVRSGSFRSCERVYESVAHLNYWRCPSLYNEIGT